MREFEVVKSARGREMLMVDGFKFGFHKLLNGGAVRSTCSAKKIYCKAFIKTSAGNNIITDTSLIHSHEKKSLELLNRQIVSNNVKVKATEDFSEPYYPIKLIDEELNQNVYTFSVNDVNSGRRKLCDTRRLIITAAPKIADEVAEMFTGASPAPLDETITPGKRSLEHESDNENAKKIKLSQTDSEATRKLESPVIKEPVEISTLDSFTEFMKSKTVDKLTRSQLEQFCLQKICEAIVNKSEVGELRHQLRVQEQMVELWRKEIAQLSKQTRDLEIVNKRLLHEIRQKNDKEKPVTPVKITRSVGLQVKLEPAPVVPAKRRVTKGDIPTSIQAPVKIKFAGPLQKKVTARSQNPSLLSQALQKENAANNAGANSSPASTPTTTTGRTTTSTTPVSKSSETKHFIDLTDEDDKRAANSTPTTQSIRIVTSQVKPAISASPGVVTSAAPRFMYVVNNQMHQGVLLQGSTTTDPTRPGAQKTVMLKLNNGIIGQSNGIIPTIQNGTSPISVVPQQTNAVKSGQQVRLTNPITTAVRSFTPATKVAPAKHPAPLPLPPAAQLTVPSRKPIPPKPHLSIRRSGSGIVLSWKMPYNLDLYEDIASYQLYAYQETSSAPSSDMWRKVGDVKALALPMACTLTQFADGNKYHFAVRAVDVQKRMGPFSDPEQILL